MKINNSYKKKDEDSIKFTSPLVPKKFLKFIKKEDKILDLGCGYGRVLEYLYQESYRNLTGIDPSKKLIQRARLNLKSKNISGINLKVGTIKDIKKEKFKVIIICAVIEYIPTAQERIKFVSLLSRLLQKDGLVYIETFVRDNKNKKLYKKATEKGFSFGSLILPDKKLILFHDSYLGIDYLFKNKFKKVLSKKTSFSTWTGKKTEGYEVLFRKR